jgi:hypothetical protein
MDVKSSIRHQQAGLREIDLTLSSCPDRQAQTNPFASTLLHSLPAGLNVLIKHQDISAFPHDLDKFLAIELRVPDFDDRSLRNSPRNVSSVLGK